MEKIENTKSPLDRTQLLNRNSLKYAIIVCMLIDHFVHVLRTAYGYVGIWYLAGRIISRLTAPIMCYFLAEGFRYTRSVKKYTTRLGIFAIVSHLPFIFFETAQWSPVGIFDGNVSVDAASFLYVSGIDKTIALYKSSMIFTLFLGILTLSLWEKTKLHPCWKALLTVGICAVATFGDWSYWAILYILCFYFLREKPVWMWSTYVGISLLYMFNINLDAGLVPIVWMPEFRLYRIGTLLVLPTILLLYNGKPGSKSPFHKWFFYIFYPLHLVILSVLFY